MTAHGEFFSSYIAGDYGNVRMGNNETSKITGIGNIILETNTGCKLILKDVRHVPDIRLNLISAGKLDDEGFHSHFGDGCWKLTKGSLIIAKGRKCNTLYLMPAKLSKGDLNLADDATIEMWHRRLGHMSEKGLQMLMKKQLLPDLKGTSLKPCTDCFAGKQHRVAFQRNTPSRRSHILDLIHTDVCYMKDLSMGGALYFVTFIDDHSRKLWTFALKSKDQVLNVFKQFHSRVERETGRKLICVRADNGGEYRGPLEQYCVDHGIKLEKTVPKTPQQNGVAERMNRTITERVKCMLSQAKLPKSFWGEAMRTAVDLINLSPSYALDGDIPEKVWTGKDISYNHLRVFGCRAFVHIPRDERAKLDANSKQCIFLGYAHDEYGYRLWDPVDKKIIRSRDVVFIEDQTIEDIEKAEKTTSSGQIPTNVDPAPLSDFTDGRIVEDTEVYEPQQQVELRRSSRDRRPSVRYSPEEYVMITDGGEPECYEEAMTHDKKKEWVKAMQEEIKSLHENKTYELVQLPKGKRPLRNKWVYRLKTDENSSQPRYKARLVVKGFSQKMGVDFEEIFSPVVKMSSIRVVLSIAARLNLEIEQMDMKTAFLHGDLEEEI